MLDKIASPASGATAAATGTEVFKTMQPQSTKLARSESGGSPTKGQITSTPQFVRLMTKSPNLRQVPYAEYAKSIRSAGGAAPPANSSGAYFRVLTGANAGQVVDMSKEKFPGKYMSSAMKIDLMEYGFGRSGLQKMGNVTRDQFAKANSDYRKTLEDSQGSSTGATRRALKDLEALGDKAIPNGSPAKSARVPTKVDDLPPFLRGEVYGKRMTFAEAVQVMKREQNRRATTEDVTDAKECYTKAEVRNEHSVKDGRSTVSSNIYAETKGSYGTVGTKTTVKASNPNSNKPLRALEGRKTTGADFVPGDRSEVRFETEFTQPYREDNPTPNVEVNGQCKFQDGTKKKAHVLGVKVIKE